MKKVKLTALNNCSDMLFGRLKKGDVFYSKEDKISEGIKRLEKAGSLSIEEGEPPRAGADGMTPADRVAYETEKKLKDAQKVEELKRVASHKASLELDKAKEDSLALEKDLDDAKRRAGEEKDTIARLDEEDKKKEAEEEAIRQLREEDEERDSIKKAADKIKRSEINRKAEEDRIAKSEAKRILDENEKDLENQKNISDQNEKDRVAKLDELRKINEEAEAKIKAEAKAEAEKAEEADRASTPIIEPVLPLSSDDDVYVTPEVGSDGNYSKQDLEVMKWMEIKELTIELGLQTPVNKEAAVKSIIELQAPV